MDLSRTDLFLSLLLDFATQRGYQTPTGRFKMAPNHLITKWNILVGAVPKEDVRRVVSDDYDVCGHGQIKPDFLDIDDVRMFLTRLHF
jgi:hypothetical protein